MSPNDSQALVTWNPNATLPIGLTDSTLVRFDYTPIGDRLDDHFARNADWLFGYYSRECKKAIEANCNLYAFECAKAMAHWRQVGDDYRRGFALDIVAVPIEAELIEAELVEDGR